MAKKEMEWVPFDYNEVEGFSLLKEAKTTSERKRAFNEIEKYPLISAYFSVLPS